MNATLIASVSLKFLRLVVYGFCLNAYIAERWNVLPLNTLDAEKYQ